MSLRHMTVLLLCISAAAVAHAQPERDGPLHDAAIAGNLLELERLLEQGMDVDAPGIYGATALHRAVRPMRRLDPDKQLATVDFLIEHGADVNARTAAGTTPLFFVSSDDLAIAFRLIDAGADVAVLDKDGTTPLAAILSNSHPGDIELARLLARMLPLGLDINAADVTGTTALHIAAQRTPRLVDELIGANADPNAVTGRGETSLHFLSMRDPGKDPGIAEAIEALIAAGADVNAVDKLRNTPLTRATAANARVLLAHSAAVDLPDSVPPLYEAAFRGEVETVELLLAAGADPRRRWRGDNAMDRAYEGLEKNAGGYKRAESHQRGRAYLEIIERLDAAGGTSIGDKIVRSVGLHPALWRIIKTWGLIAGVVFSPAIALLLLAIFAAYSKRAKTQPWGRALARASWYSLTGTGFLLAIGIFLAANSYEAAFAVMFLVFIVTWAAAILQIIFWYGLLMHRASRPSKSIG